MSKTVEKKSVSAIDEIIMAHARSKSPEDIAALTGMKPKAVIERLEQILHADDWLTDRQKEKLLLMEVEKMFGDLQVTMQSADSKLIAGMANSARQMVDMMIKVRKARADVDTDIEKITQVHAKLFGQAFDKALTYMMDTLMTDYDISYEIIYGTGENDDFGLMGDAMKLATEELKENTYND